MSHQSLRPVTITSPHALLKSLIRLGRNPDQPLIAEVSTSLFENREAQTLAEIDPHYADAIAYRLDCLGYCAANMVGEDHPTPTVFLRITYSGKPAGPIPEIPFISVSPSNETEFKQAHWDQDQSRGEALAADLSPKQTQPEPMESKLQPSVPSALITLSQLRGILSALPTHHRVEVTTKLLADALLDEAASAPEPGNELQPLVAYAKEQLACHLQLMA